MLLSAVLVAFAATTIVAWIDAPPSGGRVGTAFTFTTVAIISAEVSMRLAWPRTRRDRVSRDLLSAWLLPIALLLPPAYAATAVIVVRGYVQLRISRVPTLKLVYNTATLGLSYMALSAVARLMSGRDLSASLTAPAFHDGASIAVALGVAVITWWFVNCVLICGIVALTTGWPSVRGFFRDREGIVVDAVSVCIGVLAAYLWATDPLAVTLLVPPVLLLQHQFFSGLRQAVRTDLLTEAANPQFWRETAAREIERATASGANLSVLMIDIDHFKQVNDQHGHLAGDEVLAAVARTISKALRPSDLVGRLGGEEFGAILAGQNLLDAQGAAERVREQLAETRVRSDRGDWIRVTASIGVAELSVTRGDLRQLLDAADRALYAAKAAGRNCVRVAGPRAGEVIDLTTGGADTTRRRRRDSAQPTAR